MRRHHGVCLWAAALVLGCAPPALLSAGPEWKPVDPADLALTTAKVEPGADAEAIFWEVRLTDEEENGVVQAVLHHYLRVKIFTERGRAAQSTVDLPFFERNKIEDIAGRTIRPNGEIVELKKDSVFERVVLKGHGVKVKAKSFAMPGVEIGSIIECRWKEVRVGQLSSYERLPFAREIPVQTLTYHIKPFTGRYFSTGMRAYSFAMDMPVMAKDEQGYYHASVSNVKAFREEPRMPPETQVRPALLIYYSYDRGLPKDEYWREYGRGLHLGLKRALKPNDEVRRAAEAATQGATTDDEKLRRLFHFVKANVKDVRSPVSGLTEEERRKFKENKSVADVLKRGMGTGGDLNLLFAAMANALGYDVRTARMANREYAFINLDFLDDYLVRSGVIAVKVANEWKFFALDAPYVAYGMLPWQVEGMQAILSDPEAGFFARTPLSPAAASLARREGVFRLDAEGTLEGDVTVVYSGHIGTDFKHRAEILSDSQREEDFRGAVRDQLSAAEVTKIRIENATHPAEPIRLAYHVKVPRYAQRTGKRLFLQPNYFRVNYPPEFPESTRRLPIYFHYPWSEHDSVTIHLPEGFALDAPEAPLPINMGEVGRYQVDMQISKDGSIFQLDRTFIFGQNGAVLFPRDTYPQLKRIFDAIHQSDNHTLTFKGGAIVSSTAAPAAGQ